MESHNDSTDDLLQLAKMGFGGKSHQQQHRNDEHDVITEVRQPDNASDASAEQQDSADEEYDDEPYTHDEYGGATSAVSKFLSSSSSKKANRKARKAAAAAAGPSHAGSGLAATAAPAGPADDDVAVAGPASEDPKHERKQKQRKQQAKAVVAGAGKAGSSSSSGGIAEGKMTAGEEAMLQHALTQISYLKQIAPFTFEIKQGHTRGMSVPARFFASPQLLDMVVSEAQASSSGSGGFTASLQQLANVATLPGIVGASVGMPDLHSGYGFAIGNVCAVDLEAGNGVVSPGGVGFDINCGVRLLRSNLSLEDLLHVKDKLADALFKSVPVGVGSEGSLRLSSKDMDKLLNSGMAFTQQLGLSWPEDREVTEEHGCFPGADASKVSARAKARGAGQCGTLGSGNHYVEVQVVDEVFDLEAAAVMGLDKKGTVCIMIHSGSRGLGHQVCTDYLSAADRAMARAGLRLVDRQLAAAPLSSQEGADYLAAMAAAANYAFANRSLMAQQVRGAFAAVFGSSATKLGLHQVYDVSHNIAKKELHTLPDGSQRKVLVHRKGATRAFPPGHPDLPDKYKAIGQPVLIGGSMGTASYVMTGTQGAMQLSFGSTCHGAGRALSRSAAMRGLDSKHVLSQLSEQGISVRIATKKLAAEEAPESYKDVSQVIDTCHAVGISKKCVRLRPVIVVKG